MFGSITAPGRSVCSVIRASKDSARADVPARQAITPATRMPAKVFMFRFLFRALGFETQVLAEERHHEVLETHGHRAGMRTLVFLESAADAETLQLGL